MLLFKLLLSLLFFFASSCAPAHFAQKSNNTSLPVKQHRIHVVRKRDSLWKISRLYNVDMEKIIAENNITRPDNLKISQKLIIPFKKYKNTQFVWPAQGQIITFYNQKDNKIFSQGIDIKLSKKTNIFASNSGKVTFSNTLGGWGKTIVLEHPNNFYTIYANLAKITVKPGQRVKRGEVIASSGTSGKDTIHFEVRKNYIPKNPLKYLN